MIIIYTTLLSAKPRKFRKYFLIYQYAGTAYDIHLQTAATNE